MKKLFLLCVCVLTAAHVHAQIYSYPNLARQFSTSYATGSARMQGLGGNYGVLGADLSAIAGNPAGLGFYTRSEVGITLATHDAQTKATYLDQSTQESNSSLRIPNFGVVITGDYMNRSDWRGTFGIGYSQRVIFSQPLKMEGTNNRSSYLDKLIEKADNRYKFAGGRDIDGNFIDDEYELKGVPIRLAIGNRDMENGTIELARRDTREKTSMAFEGIEQVVVDTLSDIQEKIYAKALAFRTENTHIVNTWDEFNAKLDAGGFISAHWDGTSETEDKIKDLTKATIRCIPLDAKEETGKCILTGNPSNKRVLFARAY